MQSDARFAELQNLQAKDEESKLQSESTDEQTASEKLLKDEGFQTKYNEFMMRSIGKSSEEGKGEEAKLEKSSGVELKRTMTTVQEEEKEYEPETTEESAFRKTTEISVYGHSNKETYYEEEDNPLSEMMREEINKLVILPFDEFRDAMVVKFTAAVFDAGYEIIKTSTNLASQSMDLEEYEVELVQKLTPLIKDAQQLEDFLNFCQSYLIANF